MMYTYLCRMLSGVLLLAAAQLFAATVTPPPAELLSSGRADAAIAALHAQLASAPRDAEAYALLMRVYHAMENWDEAIAAGQQAVALDPNNSRYHLWLGRAYGEKADHSSWVTAVSTAKKARSEFEKAVQLNGNNMEARSDLAEFYLSAPSFLGGGKDKAQLQAEQLRVQGNLPASLWIQAKLAEADKNYGLAEQQLQAAVSASQGSPERILDLASFYRRRGRMPEMENTINQAVSAATRAKHTSLLLEAAQLLNRANRNLDGALQLVQSYITSPQHSEDAPIFQAYYLLGAILEKRGDKRAAAEQYRAALSLASGFQPAQSALKRLQ